MKRTKIIITLLAAFAFTGTLLLGCSANNTKTDATATPSATASPAETTGPQTETESATRDFTDWTGHTVQVPTTPQRVIYHGETTGDLLALGVIPIGTTDITGAVYEDLLPDAVDVGFPIEPEKAMSLNPDLIIFSNADEAQYAQLAKVAPTVTFDTFASLDDRMRTLGDLLNKKQEAEDWIAAHHTATDEMWKKLHENGLKEGETATVLTMYPGKRLFVMAGAGLPQFIYEKNGFKPVTQVAEMIKEGQGFVEISTEVLPEIAGDRLFILTPVTSDARNESNELVNSAIWKKLPAVQAGKVYEFDIMKATSDAKSREWLTQELPKQLLK
ncbi:ABC transporter substrate-binding protein [Paenibacillus radicis (ex Gao et al. 2016)]|uniref:ABC transporter substrate-binding protein n=1 Tax=Paenibacillus radicis (ex Gao et al. 2016) TaxID=1737354 RepID=UPI001E28AEE0|nr:ABC transporter substrate-binding protein [Paenibacillus radicis (ex Gao et al. 2016)]